MLVVIGCGQFASFLNGEDSNYVEIGTAGRAETVRVAVDEATLGALLALARDSGHLGAEPRAEPRAESRPAARAVPRPPPVVDTRRGPRIMPPAAAAQNAQFDDEDDLPDFSPLSLED